MDNKIKSIVITGVSTGIGYGAAKELVGKSYRVFGSVRKKEDADRLKKEFGDNFHPLIFDITDHQAIKKAAIEVKSIIGDDTLTGLINNAGATEGGPLMYYPIETFRKYLEVLVTGQLAVCQAFLPMLGASKEFKGKSGRIMMISSTSGKGGMPFIGAYAAAKHALEGLSKSLRGELLMYGIEVIVIGPGNIATPIWEKNLSEKFEIYKETDYYLPMVRMHNYLDKIIPTDSMDPDWFCRKLVRIFEKKRPSARYTIVKNPLKHWFLKNLLSEKLKNRIINGMMGMKIDIDKKHR